MEYPFWVNDFNRISNYQEKYPLALEYSNIHKLFGMEIIQKNQKNTWKIQFVGY